MARKPRIDFPGAWHHVMHRGARRAPIFRRDEECLRFLLEVEKAVERFGIEVHGYSLMPNHYHLLVRSVHGNLSSAMQHINGQYTQKANIAERFDGPVFRGRFHNQLVRSEAHLPHILAYIHLNPLRANLVTRLDDDAWTSHLSYCGQFAPSWLRMNFFLQVFGSGQALHEYVLDLHQGRRSWPEQMALDTGWLAQLEESVAAHSSATALCPRVSVERVLDLVVSVTGASLEELRTVRMGRHANPARRFAAVALHRYALATHRVIREALAMSSNQVANVLRRQATSTEPLANWREQLESNL